MEKSQLHQVINLLRSFNVDLQEFPSEDPQVINFMVEGHILSIKIHPYNATSDDDYKSAVETHFFTLTITNDPILKMTWRNINLETYHLNFGGVREIVNFILGILVEKRIKCNYI